MSSNPLLAILPGQTEILFDAIVPEHVDPAIDTLLGEARAELARYETTSEPATFDGVVLALERMTDRITLVMSVLSHLEGVVSSPELREAYNRVQPRVTEFLAQITLSEKAFARVATFAAKKPSLGVLENRFLEKTVTDFRRNGAALGRQEKERLLALDVELAQQASRYAQNVIDSAGSWDLRIEDASSLEGLPSDVVEAARQSAEAKGFMGFRLTLQTPCYIAVMTHAKNAALRERLYRAYNARAAQGTNSNCNIIYTILRLRDERAKLLGYKHHADFVLEQRMAKSSEAALDFVAHLEQAARPRFEEETTELRAFRREFEGSASPELAPWDVTFYAEKLRQHTCHFDEEALRPYFALDRVLAGLFDVAKHLYGISVRPWEGARTWHPSVQSYEMHEEGRIMARFYVDLFPREGKLDGAWMHGLTHALDGGPHLGLIVANVSPAVGQRQALLSRREVETLFHEFGHLLHHSLSKVPIRSLAGTNVPTDFVELPSKIMENWVWEREALALFAKHSVTQAPMPNDLLERSLAARTFRATTALMRQLGFSRLDLALHTTYVPDRDGDVLAFARAVMGRYSPVALPDDYAMIASFTHLFADPIGYAAGYYSYLWSEQLDAHAFERFARAGIFHVDTGLAFRSTILEQGHAADPMDLFKRFTGSAPDVRPMLRRIGIAA